LIYILSIFLNFFNHQYQTTFFLASLIALSY